MKRSQWGKYQEVDDDDDYGGGVTCTAAADCWTPDTEVGRGLCWWSQSQPPPPQHTQECT